MFTNPFFVLCVFIKGIQAAIKQEREFNSLTKDLNRINKEFSQSKKGVYHVFVPINPEIVLIHQTTPFTYKEAEEIYNVSKEYSIPKAVLIEFVIKSGLGAIYIREVIEKK